MYRTVEKLYTLDDTVEEIIEYHHFLFLPDARHAAARRALRVLGFPLIFFFAAPRDLVLSFTLLAPSTARWPSNTMSDSRSLAAPDLPSSLPARPCRVLSTLLDDETTDLGAIFFLVTFFARVTRNFRGNIGGNFLPSNRRASSTQLGS